MRLTFFGLAEEYDLGVVGHYCLLVEPITIYDGGKHGGDLKEELLFLGEIRGPMVDGRVQSANDRVTCHKWYWIN